MANRRMFSKDVVESDDFYELSKEAQLLYFHLSMYADDDGFLKAKKKVSACLAIGDDAYKELILSGFVLDFGNGVTCIRHWNISNQLKKDRYKETIFYDEMAMTVLSNGVYYIRKDEPSEPEPISESEPEPISERQVLPWDMVDLKSISDRKCGRV